MAERVSLRERRPDELDYVQVEVMRGAGVHARLLRQTPRFLAVGSERALRPFIEAGEFRLCALWSKGYDVEPSPWDGDCIIDEVGDGKIVGWVENLIIAPPETAS